MLNRLGGGTYGVVYHVRHRVDGVEYAMKIIRVPSRSVRKFFAVKRACKKSHVVNSQSSSTISCQNVLKTITVEYDEVIWVGLCISITKQVRQVSRAQEQG